MQVIVLIFIFLTITGCVNSKRVLINPNTGEQRDCSVQGWGWLGTPVALAHQSNCIDTAKALGFLAQEEAKLSEPPTFTTNLTPPISPVVAPTLDIGDTWSFKKGANIIVRKVTAKVTHKEQPAYLLEFTEDSKPAGRQINTEDHSVAQITDAVGKVFDFDPPNKAYSWPLKVEGEWQAKGTYITPTGEINVYTKRRVTGFGKVQTPAGSFEAFHIVSETVNGGRVAEIWYAPKTKSYVKSIVYTAAGREVEELVSFAFTNSKLPLISAAEASASVANSSGGSLTPSKAGRISKSDESRDHCSPDQILQMIKMGMSEVQVKAACK